MQALRNAIFTAVSIFDKHDWGTMNKIVISWMPHLPFDWRISVKLTEWECREKKLNCKWEKDNDNH